MFILRLPLHSLQSLAIIATSISQFYWSSLPEDVRDALGKVIHFSTPTSLTLRHAWDVPVDLFLGPTGIRTLDLEGVYLDILNSGQNLAPSYQIPRSRAESHGVIQRLSWSFPDMLYTGL